MAKKQALKLNGDAVVFVDWANVFGWPEVSKKKIEPRKIYALFSSYTEIKDIRFYFGKDSNKKSENFLDDVNKLGFSVVSKDVKYIKIKGIDIVQRKCDFDLEIALDCMENINTYKTFIFLSGDGDFATLYERLIAKGKQVIVIYEQGRLGREVWDIEKGLFKTRLSYIM